ncbi:MAG: ATPase domain-containing protein [Halobacteriales archaeon]
MVRITEEDRVSSGVEMLDRMLGGGIPKERSVLVTGGPGTGKSTIAMQFLQEGLENGDECLFVSTEQTVDELRDSFEPFEFELNHENLGVTSVHAKPGRTLESDELELVLQTLGNEPDFVEGFDVPFTSEYIVEYLREYAPCDRVVLDSASGLRAVSENAEVFRRTALDLIRLFTDEMGATSLFTAEGKDGDESGNPLRFTTHGVVRLWHEEISEDPHRFLRVSKMRGVDHDRRRVEVEFDDGGVSLSPKRRSQPPALKQHKHLSVGVDGLDRLCGGGIVRGGTVLLQHDGHANLASILGSFVSTAVEKDYTLVLLPTTHLTPMRVGSVLEEKDVSVGELLGDDRLFVLDMTGSWSEFSDSDNVREATDDVGDVVSFFRNADGSGEAGTFAIAKTGTAVHRLGPGGARELQHFQEIETGSEDVVVNVHNPAVTDSRISGFFVDAAEQVLETRVLDDGLQYLTLRKSPCGFVGSTSLVEFRKKPPYFRVQNPPRERENPMSVD